MVSCVLSQSFIMCLGSVVKDRGDLSPSAFLGSPLEESQDQCKCENLLTFQNLANEEVRKLTQRYILFLWDALRAVQTIATSQVTVGFHQHCQQH